MEWTEVSSSTLRAVAWDDLVLEVEFKTGAVYRYTGVPRSEYDGLLGAPSHGSYFNARIKKGPYPYTRVR